MAQYYNFVTNASGTLTLEEVHSIYSVNGQTVQLVVEDVNNGGNGTQPFLTYATAAENSTQAIFSQPAINLGSQNSATQLEQGQNVYIIKTNQLTAPGDVLTTTTGNDNTVSDSVANIVDNKGSKALLSCSNDGRQIQWIKMQENSINVNAVSKQGTLISERTETASLNRNQLLNNTSAQTLPHGHCELQPMNVAHTKRKPSRISQNRSRQSTNSIQIGTSSAAPDGEYVTTSVETRTQNSNVSNTRVSTPSFHNKSVGPAGQNVTHVSGLQLRTPLNTRTSTPSQMSKNLIRQQPEMEHLSESIKQARLIKQMQNEQRSQASNAQRVSNVPSQTGQTSSNNAVARQQTPAKTVLQRQHMLSGSQLQKSPAVTQKPQYEQQLPLSPPPENVHTAMETESPQSPDDKGPVNQQCFASQTEPENSSSESYAYLQSIIDNPANTIVQHHIKGNTAKMLVTLSNAEQRLITFDIPNGDCTVQDLLEQANIITCGATSVSLVSDPHLGINYIVEAGPGTVMASQDINESIDGTSIQENVNASPDNSSRTASPPDENSNPTQQNEEPKYVEGWLAVCTHCGFSSLDFRRCLRCKTKLPKDVKTIPIMGTQEKKEAVLSVDTFYKKNNDRSASTKVDKPERDGSAYKRGRGRGRGVSKQRPIHKEPECLTISSDEEDEGKHRKLDKSNNSALSNDASNDVNEEMEPILGKEPVITNTSISSSTNYDYPLEDDFDTDNTIEAPHTSLLCRTVRIGSYKYIPRERVMVSQTGVRFSVPLLEDDQSFVTLEVKIQDIVKVLIHFGKAMPVLFFYTSTNTGAMIRELLGMQDPKGPYYDPAGRDHTHKRITLLPDEWTEESRIVLKAIFLRRGLMDQLSAKEANDILIRASPKDSLQVQSLSRRDSQATSSSSSASNASSGIQTITVYPPPPAKGGIAINTEDYLCLGEDQFLNDVIIDFYLKYLTLEVLSESDQHRTHVFSSYFYKRLTSPNTQSVESNVPLSAAAKRHARVQKWTKNVNIFDKDFIIIPINEHAHWFLAIICFPGLVGKVPTNCTFTKDEDIQKTIQRSKKLKEVKLQAVTVGSTIITPIGTTITIEQVDDGSERDEAEGDEDEMEMDSDDDEDGEFTGENKNPQPKVEPSVPQELDTVKVPCILIFDSLAGASRARVVATLRDYLSCEHVAKMGSEKVFSKDTIKGSSLKVPQQSNFTDCGLYVLQYVESFFQNPIKDYTLPIKTLKYWFEEIVVTRKREELSKLLINLMNSTKGDKNINIPTVIFPTQDGKLKVKAENNVEMKPVKQEVENNKKPTLDSESRSSTTMSNTTETTEPTNEIINRTAHSIIPYSPSTSSNSTDSNPAEMQTEPKTPLARSCSKTMTYLKSARIARLMTRTENQDDTQAAKKHKGESFDSCK